MKLDLKYKKYLCCFLVFNWFRFIIQCLLNLDRVFFSSFPQLEGKSLSFWFYFVYCREHLLLESRSTKKTEYALQKSVV